MKKKIMLVMAALLMCIALLPAAAWAAGVVIEQNDEVVDIGKKIQGEIDKLRLTGGTVTVTGQKDGADETLHLVVHENVTVVWKAKYSGGVNDGDLINIVGFGTFEVADGCVKAEVEVSAEPDGEPIIGETAAAAYAISGTFGKLVVTGGEVSATAIGGDIELATAISVNYGSLTVTGGEVSATTEDEDGNRDFDLAIAIYGNNSEVTVTGGQISVQADYGNGIAAFAIVGSGNSEIMVTGGIIEAEALGIALGIGTADKGEQTVTVAGGSVKAEAGMIAMAIGATSEGTSKVTVVDGELTAVSDRKAEAIALKNGAVTVIGGKVKAIGDEYGEEPPAAISITKKGVAAYLKDTCIGGFKVVGEDNFESAIGMIVEVEDLTIPSSYHGESEGLMKKAGGVSAVWDAEGVVTEIVFTLEDASKMRLVWGPGSCDTGGGSCGNTGVGTLGALIMILGAAWAAKRRG